MAVSAVHLDKTVDESKVKKIVPVKGKHPLQYKWTFSFNNTFTSTQNYEKGIKMFHEFDTVEDFFACFNHIRGVSKLDNNDEYYVFKMGYQPMVEDDKNKDGERCIITIKGQVDRHENIWLNCILLTIGCGFGKLSEEIIGVNCSKREENVRIVFWFKDTKKSSENNAIVNKFLAACELDKFSVDCRSDSNQAARERYSNQNSYHGNRKNRKSGKRCNSKGTAGSIAMNPILRVLSTFLISIIVPFYIILSFSSLLGTFILF